MTGRISLLGALLALQLIIIAAVLLVETGVGDAQEGPFLAFDAEAVDEVTIATSEDGTGITLTRTGDGWRLPDGLPADAGKVNDLLERLDNLQAPWPVATSGSARERFEVTDDSYQRHLVLRAGGDPVVDLYLGTSPGYQRVHARRADADAVYSVALSNYQLPADPGEWLDKTLLQPSGDIAALARLDHWRLERSDDGWQLTAPVESEAGAGTAAASNAADPADADAARQLVRRFAELRVMGKSVAPAGDSQPAARFQVTDAEGDYTLTLWRHGDDQPLTIASSRRDQHFELAGYLADQLLAERTELLPSSDEQTNDEADPAADSGGG